MFLLKVIVIFVIVIHNNIVNAEEDCLKKCELQRCIQIPKENCNGRFIVAGEQCNCCNLCLPRECGPKNPCQLPLTCLENGECAYVREKPCPNIPGLICD